MDRTCFPSRSRHPFTPPSIQPPAPLILLHVDPTALGLEAYSGDGFVAMEFILHSKVYGLVPRAWAAHTHTSTLQKNHTSQLQVHTGEQHGWSIAKEDPDLLYLFYTFQRSGSSAQRMERGCKQVRVHCKWSAWERRVEICRQNPLGWAD